MKLTKTYIILFNDLIKRSRLINLELVMDNFVLDEEKFGEIIIATNSRNSWLHMNIHFLEE